MRHQDNRPAARPQRRMDIAQTLEVVLDVLQHIQTDNGIHAFVKRREIVGVGQVAGANLKVRPMMEARSQAGDVLFVNIGGYVHLTAGDELPGKIAYTGADLQYSFSHVWPDRIGHPGIESAGARKNIQDFGPGALVDIFREVIPENYVNRLDCIPKADLLALLIASSVIADGHFIDPDLPARHLDRQLRLDPEAVATNGDAAEQGGAERLVAGLHI